MKQTEEKGTQGSKPPPKWPDKLLEKLCAPQLLEEVIGDLHERYYLRVQREGVKKARKLYLGEVLAYMRPSIIQRKPSTPTLNPIDMFQHFLLLSFRSFMRFKSSFFINLIGLPLWLF